MIDLKNLIKQTGGGEKPPSAPVSSFATRLAEKKAAVLNEPKTGITYFYSQKPNLGIFISATTRIQFKGNYFETADSTIADYIKKHYSKIVDEITHEQQQDRQTFKY